MIYKTSFYINIVLMTPTLRNNKKAYIFTQF